MNLSDHFTLAELTRSDYAIRRGLDNTPNPDQLANLHVLAQGLERVRAVIGKPLHITSGFRSLKVNAGIGGAANSYHTHGLAADFNVDGLTPAQVCLAIERSKKLIQYDKVILEFGIWVHLQFSHPDEPPRLATYTITSAKTGYVPGIHV